MRYFIVIILIFSFTFASSSQSICTDAIDDILNTMDTQCSLTERNELCYGNQTVTITPDDQQFRTPGDIISIADLESISTSAFEDADNWGIAMMLIQANLPQSLPGQNVTFLFFGDATIENATTQKIVATATSNANVRSGPSTDYAVSGTLQANMSIQLIGRNAAGDWLYFVTEDVQGWLYHTLLQTNEDIMVLEEIPADFAVESTASAMQAVYFLSGIGQSECTNIPSDGLLIHTPAYDEPIELIVNGVEISLGSTAYIQAQPDADMVIFIIEGSANVTANDITVTVPEGAVTSVSLDIDLQPTSPPTSPQPYQTDDVVNAPVSALSDDVIIAEPATQESIDSVNLKIDGTWVGIDGDGSTTTVSFESIGDDEYAFTYLDSATSEDAGCNTGPIGGSGQGTLVDNMLSIDVSFACVDTDVAFNFTLIYTFDPNTNTLSEDWSGLLTNTYSR